MQIPDKVYETITIDDENIIEIIESEYFQRLKYINQYGGVNLIFPGQYKTSRFEHSIGVYHLLKELGADYETQIAGLLHDSGHAPLSHLIERVEEWKDFEHFAMLRYPGSDKIKKLLKKLRIKLKPLDEYKLIKQKLPHFGVDRIDYGVRDYIETEDKNYGWGKNIIENTKIYNNEVVFTDLETARSYAQMAFESIYNVAYNPEIGPMYGALQNIYQKAYDNKLLDTNKVLTEILTDADLLSLIHANPDLFEYEIKIIENKLKFKRVSKTDKYDLTHTIDKLRIYNPFVLIDNDIRLLTEIDPEFNNYFLTKASEYEQNLINYYILV